MQDHVATGVFMADLNFFTAWFRGLQTAPTKTFCIDI